jgi:hypothetical protein
MATNRIVRAALIAAGTISVGIAILGMFLPLLPSFEFLLLAALCYGKSSPRASLWLTTNRLFGQRFTAYRDLKGATVATKVGTLATLWGGMAITAWLIGPVYWVDATLLAIAIGVTIHVLRLRTLPGPSRA